jgi:hypothetical protein
VLHRVGQKAVVGFGRLDVVVERATHLVQRLSDARRPYVDITGRGDRVLEIDEGGAKTSP